jgi:acyl transferase domain-containing protein/SAM-dependent methyltransferase
MSESTNPAELSTVKRALIDLRALRARVAELESRNREPMAIVGMSVRAPGGVVDVAGFAELLWSGTDAISDVPPDRWPIAEWYGEAQDAPGKMYMRRGGFLANVTDFDAEFFGIAPVEAASMDPQQRLVLELAWEALEHAGIAPSALAGTAAGVYLGIANGDYGRALFSRPDLIDPYFSSGNAYSVAAGRVAYALGLNGPAIAVDTACSSSLVALHLACQGLRHGDCDIALVGGVNLILSPEVNVNFCKAGMLARDGRCRTFDAAATGYVRGEGGGMVVVRRLRDAIATGDRILAIVRGTAINQDGRSSGLTAPNGPAQQAVVRAALEAAGVEARFIGYVEAHGTGTPLGDPVELGALATVLSEGRPASTPVAIGSVKTNIGHLEAAAGIMGVIKTVLALERHEVPPHLHLETPNPLIDWHALPIVVPTATTAWPAIEGRRLAGVSAFGFSGTNAHAILEAGPGLPIDVDRGAPGTLQLLAISARDPEALRQIADRYRRLLSNPVDSGDDFLQAVCATANTGRTHFARRLSVTATSFADLACGLEGWLKNGEAPGVMAGGRSSGAAAPRIAFLFPGQGVQYSGMGRALYDTAPAFREAFDAVDRALDPLLGRSIVPIVYPPGSDQWLVDPAAFAQPALFAFEIALAALWRSWGIAPAAVLGHSFGEYAAACVAGALSVEDAARMVVARGRLTALVPGHGAMTVIEAGAEEVDRAILADGGALSVAALNGPLNTVISGERGAVERIAADFSARGRRTTSLNVGHAFHSPLMDPILDEFEREIGVLRCAAPSMALVSTATGEPADAALLGSARYWRNHLRQPVRFAAAMSTLAGRGITHFIEIGPHPALLGMGAACIPGGTWLPSMRRDQDAWGEMLRSLQTLYVDGLEVDWSGFQSGRPVRRVALPTYPFQRRRHWIEIAKPTPREARGTWEAVSAALDREAQRGPLDLDAGSYRAKWTTLARLTEAHVMDVLRDLGAFATSSERHTLDSLLEVTGIAPIHSRLVARWLERLTAAGTLARDKMEYAATCAFDPESTAALWTEAEALFQDNRELFAYVRHCGTHLAAIVTGRESPLESLFPGGSFELATGLYERSATMRYVNGLAAAAVDAAIGAAAAGSTLRVLEVGAGTGGTTSALLPVLPAARVRYCFTDVSEAFLAHAGDRFAAFSFLEFATLDLDRDPVGQGYAAASFDVIVASNAVHAVPDLRAALDRLGRLLAPGGVLVLVESTTDMAHFDMTTGLIEGWQHFADDLRGDTPLLAADQWTAALLAAGMSAVGAWPRPGSVAEALGQHVIVAVAPGSAVPAAVASSIHISETRPAQEGAPPHTVRRQLADALVSERLAVVRDAVRAEVVRILHLDPASPPGRLDRLMDLGMDSLMAVQLRNALARALDLDGVLPATLMFDHPTIEALALYLLERIAMPIPPSGRDSGAAAPVGGPAAPGVLGIDRVTAMSEQEIEALLLERLGKP